MNVKDKLVYAMQQVNNIQSHTDESKKTRLSVLQVLKEHVERAEELVRTEPEPYVVPFASFNHDSTMS